MRRPKGYIGQGHETIGSDILAVLAILKMPELVLGPEDAKRLAAVDPAGWYPIEWLLELMEKLDAAIGYYGLVRMGRTLFQLSHKDRVEKVARSARDIVYGIDGMYHNANRGRGIGGWRVVDFQPGHAELEKTTPHHCVMEQGILSAGLAMVGCPASIVQTTCFRKGDPLCLFALSSTVTDARWCGATPEPGQDDRAR
jgi:hypothetical protein